MLSLRRARYRSLLDLRYIVKQCDMFAIANAVFFAHSKKLREDLLK